MDTSEIHLVSDFFEKFIGVASLRLEEFLSVGFCERVWIG
jgi:hypothetical protein